jgi:hypothetical protein
MCAEGRKFPCISMCFLRTSESRSVYFRYSAALRCTLLLLSWVLRIPSRGEAQNSVVHQAVSDSVHEHTRCASVTIFGDRERLSPVLNVFVAQGMIPWAR